MKTCRICKVEKPAERFQRKRGAVDGLQPICKRCKNQTLILDGELPALNEIIAASKSHWSRYSRVKRGNTQIVALECRAQKLKPVDAPVEVTFRHYRPNKRKDPDNVAGGAQKAILDGLVKAKILPDDTMRYILSLHHYFEIDKKKPRIEVSIHVTNQEEICA